jgi:PD-(D/E)XK nuclease superfamily protein
VEHPKDVGDRSTLAIISVLRELGYGIYLPFGENTRCDLMLERGVDTVRVQCKTGRVRNGAIVFAVCSCYGHHRNPLTARRTYVGQIDAFAVYCPETAGVYVIPIADVRRRAPHIYESTRRGTTSATGSASRPTTRLDASL